MIKSIKKKIKLFKNRKVRANVIFTIKEITRTEAFSFVSKYHYLEDVKFLSQYNYGLFIDSKLLGVSTYIIPQGLNSVKGWIGTNNKDTTILELSRLCLHPKLNKCNASSYLLSNSMKLLKTYDIKIIITLADSTRHAGSIYQVCNFTYYGLTAKKSDFYNIDGSINKRGSTKDKNGVWLARSQKHRYAFKLDKSINVLYNELPKPSKNNIIKTICCKDVKYILDKRFNVKYRCPICFNEQLTLVETEKGNQYDK